MVDQFVSRFADLLAHQRRGADRRVHREIAPPPFATPAGPVVFERRSPLDRRAEWIREFSLKLPIVIY